MTGRRRLLSCLLGVLAMATMPVRADSVRIHECLKEATTDAEKEQCRRLPRGSGDK